LAVFQLFRGDTIIEEKWNFSHARIYCIAAKINVGVSEGRRTRRSADDSFHPQLYDLDLIVDQSAVNLHLIRNDDIQTNVPTFSLSGGAPVEQVLDDTEVRCVYLTQMWHSINIMFHLKM